MNFERHPAPYDHFNQSPSLARRVNAKKEKEDKEKSLLILKTVLITLGSVAVAGFLAFLVLRNFQGSSEGPSSTTNDSHLEPLNSLNSNQEGTLPLDPQISSPSSSPDTSTLNSNSPPYPTGHNLMLFSGSRAIFAINPADHELITDHIIDLENCSVSNSYYLSNDKMRIYFNDARNTKCFNFNGRTFGDFNPSIWDYTTFMLLKSARNDIVYRVAGINGIRYFSHYSIDESRLVYMYAITCPQNGMPILLEQTNDGSKILFSCFPTGDVFMKELNNSDLGHQRLFTLRDFYRAILSPDGSTLIMRGYDINHWVIKNLSSPDLETKSKIIRFNVDIASFIFSNFAFSNDGRYLYAIREIEISRNTYQYRLYTIDMQSLLENDYSNAASPYNLGEGREITIT